MNFRSRSKWVTWLCFHPQIYIGMFLVTSLKSAHSLFRNCIRYKNLLVFQRISVKNQILLRKIMRISFTRETVLLFYRHCILSHSSTHTWHNIPRTVLCPCWGPSVTMSWTAFRLSLSAVCRISYLTSHDHPIKPSPMIHIYITAEDWQ